jgi:16S rRNA (cytidine1402-2'-O)-methyltransferase
MINKPNKENEPGDQPLEETQSTAITAGVLYVVATPIGHLADVSPRCRQVLSAVDAVAAEDTRVTAHLLGLLGLKKPLLASHAHNECDAAHKVIQALSAGQALALVCDAGTPGVSDPGAKVVAAVAQAGFTIVPVPGPSAVLAAISASGLVEGAFYFAGFLPSKGAVREKTLIDLLRQPSPVVLFEAPHRLHSLMQSLLLLNTQNRACCVARELTKRFETFYRGSVVEVAQALHADPNAERGELVVILGAQQAKQTSLDGENADLSATVSINISAHDLLKDTLAHVPLKQAVQWVAKWTGLPRKALYTLALTLKQED